MEKTRKQKRPPLVTFIAIIFILNAISGISSTTILLSPTITASNPEVFAAVETWSALEKISPYILNVLLITSMVLFFFLKKSSIPLFGIYLALELFSAVQRVLQPGWIDMYGVRGAVILFGSIGLSGILLGYMIRLRKQEVLG